MDKFSISLVTMGVLALVAFSCNREEVQHSNEKEIRTQIEEIIPNVETVLTAVSSEIDCSVENCANPFDYMGLEHNKGLEKLLTANNTEETEVDDPVIYGQPLKEFVREKMSLIEFSKGYPSVVDSIKNAKVREGVSTILRRTREAKFNDVYEITVYLKEVDNGIRTATFLTEYEKEQLLSMTSTYRYSVNFWHERITLLKGEYATQGIFSGREWWECLIIGTADAVGGFVSGSIPIHGVGFNFGIAVKTSKYAGQFLDDIFE